MGENKCRICDTTIKNKSKVLCKKDHYYHCPNCNKTILITNWSQLNNMFKNKKSKNLPIKIIDTNKNVVIFTFNLKNSNQWIDIMCSNCWNIPKLVNKRKKIQTEKRRSTWIKKYGVDNPSKSEEIKKKKEKTWLEKYGVNNPSKSEEIKKKKEKTCLKHYGVKNNSQNKYIKEKIKQTNIKKYGVKCTLQNEEIKKKTQQTMKEKYNCEYPLQSEQLKEKRRQTIKKDVDNFQKQNDIIPLENVIEQYGSGWKFTNTLNITPIYYKKHTFINKKDIPIIKKYYNEQKEKYNSTSRQEKSIVNYIKTIYNGKIIENSKKIIPPQELDIYIPDKQIAIEYNGSYWHSDINITDKNYHYNKTQICKKKGIRLIHIYEWELQNPHWPKIQLLLKTALGVTQNKIYARQCDIKQITNKKAKKLNEQVHLQGHRNAQITYGLYHKNKLVQLMSFTQSKYNKNLKNNNQWEIIRGCPGSNTQVIGGVSKLLKHFIKNHNPELIFSYSDNNKYNGTSYIKSGMKYIGWTGPNKWWLLKNGDTAPRNPHKYKQYKNNSVATIWGAGSDKYIWKKESE